MSVYENYWRYIYLHTAFDRLLKCDQGNQLTEDEIFSALAGTPVAARAFIHIGGSERMNKIKLEEGCLVRDEFLGKCAELEGGLH